MTSKIVTAKPPPKLSTLDIAFPVDLPFLPPMSEIPEEFKHHTPWGRQAAMWFYQGPDKAWLARIQPREGIDGTDALKAIQALLGSFEPKHEHKMAGAAYLLASWFTDPEMKAEP